MMSSSTSQPDSVLTTSWRSFKRAREVVLFCIFFYILGVRVAKLVEVVSTLQPFFYISIRFRLRFVAGKNERKFPNVDESGRSTPTPTRNKVYETLKKIAETA